MSNNEFSNPETGSFQPIYPNQGQQPPAQQPQPRQQPQQPQFVMQPNPTYAYAAPAAYPQQKSGTSPAIIALISVLVVVLLGLVGAIFYVTLTKDDATNAASTQAAVNSQGQNQGQQTQPQPQQVQQPQVTQTETVVVPSSGGSGNSGYSGSSRSLAGGNLSSAWKGTSTTSDPFVNSVHNAYIRYRNSTGAESGTIRAYSPTTKLTYSMWCRPSGDNIKCTGGRNAVVYIG
ncbi:MAG: hypothetical protein Q4E11_07040 [Corynebacterium sp.]|uniref:hypothetical protein n=1 Tax=Corynebacterium sp. TaxID=1720 RepID=UPI0026DD38F1|nr:hypothetical protein [Corynebacterium sp.]MDO5030325.1 hypothetical protein [Corynebacterium sp.]